MDAATNSAFSEGNLTRCSAVTFSAAARTRALRRLARRLLPLGTLGILSLLLGACATVPDVAGGGRASQIIVSVKDQKMTVIKDGGGRVTYPISTSKFGLDGHRRSYTTPTGTLAVAQKVGGGAPEGAVFHGRVRTGEIVKVNQPGRDPIVTRILALRGLESSNHDALSRGIYIHGTPEENLIGTPASYGCIRMRSRDVIALYEMVDVGTRVRVIDDSQRGAVAASGVDLRRPAAPTASTPTLVASNTVASGAQNEAPTASSAPAPVEPAPVAPPPPPSARGSKPAAVQVVTTGGAPQKWAGSPGKLLSEKPAVPAAAVAVVPGTSRPVPAAGTRPVVNTTTTEAEATSASNNRSLRRPALDSL